MTRNLPTKFAGWAAACIVALSTLSPVLAQAPEPALSEQGISAVFGPRETATPAPTTPAETPATITVSSIDGTPAGTPVDAAPGGVPISEAAAGDSRRSTQSIEAGTALVDVSVRVNPDPVRAGGLLTYTYLYTNTQPGQISDVFVLVSWSRMKAVAQPFDFDIWQVCDNGCQPLSQAGPTVTIGNTGDSNGNNRRYNIGALNAFQSGRFQVVLRMRNDIFPRTGQELRRPAGSAQLFINNDTSNIISEDTASALLVGPVLNLSKQVRPPAPPRITIGEVVDYDIQIGNATAPTDLVNGQPRSDAIGATNLDVVDTFPIGSEYVSSTVPAGVTTQVDTVARTVRWSLGSLPVSQSRNIIVRFRRAANNDGCVAMNNLTWSATADEFPFENPGQRYRISGPAASIDVVPSVRIKELFVSRSPAAYGDEFAARIVVQNYYTQSVNGALIGMRMQNNAVFVSGTASPAPTVVAPVNAPGNTVTWTLNLPAGTPAMPSETSINFTIRAAFLETLADTIIEPQVPPSVPRSCLEALRTRLIIVPRVDVRIEKADFRQPNLVESRQPYSYAITVINNGISAASGVIVTATLPNTDVRDTSGAFPANFSYIPGSSRVNGQAIEPDVVVNGRFGYVVWRNLSLPANTNNFRINFSLNADGFEYFDYCTGASVSSAADAQRTVPDFNRVCIKINPPMDLSKEAVPGFIRDPRTPEGREVTFTLSMRNAGTSPYRVALLDYLGEFEFVRQISGYDQPLVQTGNVCFTPNTLVWPWRVLQPGQSLNAVIVARVPANPTRDRYDNEMGFRFTAQDNSEYCTVQIPPEIATVNASAGRIELGKNGPTTRVSLGQQIAYEITAKNLSSGTPVTSVVITDALPIGFEFVGMAPDSEVTTQPSFSLGFDGRTTLRWAIPQIAPDATLRIRFLVRTGATVGTFQNYVTADAFRLVELRCAFAFAGCTTVTDGNRSVPVATHQLTVEPLATLEPVIAATACANPGDTRDYVVRVVNTRDTRYDNTTVRIRVPFGFAVVEQTSPQIPLITQESNGDQTYEWSGLILPAKPFDSANAQLVFTLKLRAGQLLGRSTIIATADSPDGIILAKEGFADPVISMCQPTAPAVSKAVNVDRARAGDGLIYQITLGNPTGSGLNTAIEDVLPVPLNFVEMIEGPNPIRNGNALSWASVSVPSGSQTNPGIRRLRFRVTVGPFSGTQDVLNVAALPQGTVFDTTRASISVRLESQPPLAFGAVLVNSQCTNTGEQRVLRLTLTNSRSQAFNNIAMAVTLPGGIRYLTTGGSPLPLRTSDGTGATQLSWSGLSVPPNSTLTWDVNVVVALPDGRHPISVRAESGDGSISQPAVQPIVDVCPPTTVRVVKLANKLVAAPGEEVIYTIDVVNPTGSQVLIGLRDELPEGVRFDRNLQDGSAPNVLGRTLLWNLSVPAGTSETPGRRTIRFAVRAEAPVGRVADFSVVNRVEVASAPVQVDAQAGSVDFLLNLPDGNDPNPGPGPGPGGSRKVHLPQVRR
jgi:uncharacterized repeat protein (TIGR01451 family)